MDLFACDQCNTVDSPELTPQPNPTPLGLWLCTCCMGAGWHGRFPKEQYVPNQDFVCNRPSGIGLS